MMFVLHLFVKYDWNDMTEMHGWNVQVLQALIIQLYVPYIVISVSGMEHFIPLHADESVSFWPTKWCWRSQNDLPTMTFGFLYDVLTKPL
jgi:hypothetical protein